MRLILKNRNQGINMDFYDYINKYELAFKKKLYKTTKEKAEFDKQIKDINKEIRAMKSLFRKPLPIALTGGLVGGNMLAMLFAMMFASNLWIWYLIALVIFSVLGLANEVYEKKWKEDLDILYSDLKEAHKNKYSKEVVESRLRSLINDVHTCYQYYFYMVKEEDRKKVITINPKDVYDSRCKLSTFLHEFYNGDLEYFQNLQPYQQIREEHNLYLNLRIKEAKDKKLGLSEMVERPNRRIASQYYNQYVVSENTAIKK